MLEAIRKKTGTVSPAYQGCQNFIIFRIIKYLNKIKYNFYLQIIRYLRGDLPVYGSLQCGFILDQLMDDLVMWFSSGGTKSVWHYDDYENLNCLIAG